MIDLRVAGSPLACRDTAAALRRWADALDDTSHALRRAERDSVDAWQGSAAEAFRAALAWLRADAQDAAADVRRVADGVDVLAAALDSVCRVMEQVRAHALAAGLTVAEGQVHPAAPGGSPSDEAARSAVYARLASGAGEARAHERAAHEQLAQSAARLRPALAAWEQRFGAAGAGVHLDAATYPEGGLSALVAGVGLPAPVPGMSGAGAGRSVVPAAWARTQEGDGGGVVPGGTAALARWAGHGAAPVPPLGDGFGGPVPEGPA